MKITQKLMILLLTLSVAFGVVAAGSISLTTDQGSTLTQGTTASFLATVSGNAMPITATSFVLNSSYPDFMSLSSCSFYNSNLTLVCPVSISTIGSFTANMAYVAGTENALSSDFAFSVVKAQPSNEGGIQGSPGGYCKAYPICNYEGTNFEQGCQNFDALNFTCLQTGQTIQVPAAPIKHPYGWINLTGVAVGAPLQVSEVPLSAKGVNSMWQANLVYYAPSGNPSYYFLSS